MKTDKELLELAARAVGLNVSDYEYDEYSGFTFRISEYQEPFDSFSPLTDDGDALRLAVELQLDFYVNGKQAGCWISDSVCLTEDIDGDTYAATRRAIVRAAAAIGEKL